MTGKWQDDIVTREQYLELVSTGMAWEFYPELPLSWFECEKELEEDDG